MTLTEAELAEHFQITPRQAAEKRLALNWPHLRISRNVIRYTPEQVAAIEALLTVRNKPSKPGIPGALPGQTRRSAALNNRTGAGPYPVRPPGRRATTDQASTLACTH